MLAPIALLVTLIKDFETALNATPFLVLGFVGPLFVFCICDEARQNAQARIRKLRKDATFIPTVAHKDSVDMGKVVWTRALRARLKRKRKRSDEYESVLETLIEKEERELIRERISQLSEDKRAILDAFKNSRSMRQAAKKMTMHESSYRRKLWRIIAQLKDKKIE